MQELIIKPNNKVSVFDVFRDLWRYKDLITILAWRDYKVRYAQTALGFIWAFIQPITTLFIFIVVFGKIAEVNVGETPYAIYAQSGMLAWSYFAFLIAQAGNSIIGAQGMVKKIYFPRLVIPIAKAIVGLIDFGISLFLLIIIAMFYKFVPSINLIYLPFFLLLVIFGGLGVGIWISALTVRYRDFTHIIPFLVQIGLYASPVAYSLDSVSEKFQFFYSLNPLVGIIEGVRWCIIGGSSPGYVTIYSLIVMVVLFVSSILYFRKVERIMADLI